MSSCVRYTMKRMVERFASRSKVGINFNYSYLLVMCTAIVSFLWASLCFSVRYISQSSWVCLNVEGGSVFSAINEIQWRNTDQQRRRTNRCCSGELSDRRGAKFNYCFLRASERWQKCFMHGYAELSKRSVRCWSTLWVCTSFCCRLFASNVVIHGILFIR